MNVLLVVPELDASPYSHILPSLEKALVSTADLLTLDALDVAKRAQVPVAEVRKLADALFAALHDGAKYTALQDGNVQKGIDRPVRLTRGGSERVSTLDDVLDDRLAGGVASGHITEIVGESAVGKTQFLLTLLLSVQLPPPHGLGKSALYISTEAPLQTTRLTQILLSHPKLTALSESEKPTLARIQSIHIHDVEAQEHILRYQVPVAISKGDAGLLIVDSIAANYRAEFDKCRARKGAESFAKRSTQLSQLGALLRNIAREHHVAVVVANQVADRFTTADATSNGNISQNTTQRSRPPSPPQQTASRSGLYPQDLASSRPVSAPQMLSTDDPLALDHQQLFFTGWGDNPESVRLKTPSLGLTWTNQLGTRIALLKEPIYDDRAYEVGEDRSISGWARTAKVVFSASCKESSTDFEIWEGGVRNTVQPAELQAI